jgi:CheY-like chemotaxis protein
MIEKPKIVIADDEIHILRVLELKFRSAGFEVIQAHDGLQAWEAVRRHGPDLVITDYQMPGMTGMEVAELMSVYEEFRSIPVVILTARGFYLDKGDLARANVANVVSKPFSPRELLTLIKNVLGSVVSVGSE